MRDATEPARPTPEGPDQPDEPDQPDQPDGPDGLAVPIDFGARHGEGLELGLSLGGGGLFFVAWQVSYLHALGHQGVDLTGAARVVGTSAGSMVAAILEAEHLGRCARTSVPGWMTTASTGRPP